MLSSPSNELYACIVTGLVDSSYTIEFWLHLHPYEEGGSGSASDNSAQRRSQRRILGTAPGMKGRELSLMLHNARSFFRHGTEEIMGPRVLSAEWVHMAFVFHKDKGSLRIFHNGVKVLMREGHKPLAASTALFLGGNDVSQPLCGVISELRVWNVVRTRKQINSLMRRTFEPPWAVPEHSEEFRHRSALWAGLNASWSFSAGSLLELVRGRSIGVGAGVSSGSRFSPRFVPIESLKHRHGFAQFRLDEGLQKQQRFEAEQKSGTHKPDYVPEDGREVDAALDLTARTLPITLGQFGMRTAFHLSASRIQ